MDMDTETTFSLPTTTAPTDFNGPAAGVTAPCPIVPVSLAGLISPSQQHHHYHHQQTQQQQQQQQQNQFPLSSSPGAYTDLPWDTGISSSEPDKDQQRGAKRLCQGLFNFRGCKRKESSCSSRTSSISETNKSVEESCKRSLDHFPCPSTLFPQPTLEFDFRVAVKLRPEPARLDPRPSPPASSAGSTTSSTSSSTANTNNTPGPAQQREVTAISSGCWSGSFGNGKVLAGGYDLGQARGFRPIRIVEGVFVMQTTDDVPAILEMRTRGSLSGPCDVLDALLSPVPGPKTIDPRRYGFRMFSTIKTADKRYAEIVNCGLWVASGVWRGEELIIDAYRVT